MDSYADYFSQAMTFSESGIYFMIITIVMLIIIFVLYKTYRASLNVEARLQEFSSLSSNSFGRRLRVIEVNSNEYHLNKAALGPLAKIIESYCVCTTDKDGIITYANEKFLALTNKKINDVVGKKHSMALSSGDSTASDADFRGALDNDLAWHGELQGRTRTGSTFWLDAFVFPLSFISDVDEGYMYFGTDISSIKKQNHHLQHEVKRHEEALNKVENILLHSEKMASLGTISAGIAHEINNPIAFVASNVKRFEDYISSIAEALKKSRTRIGEEKFAQLLRAAGITEKQARDIDFILDDYGSLINETQDGIERIQRIIRDLKCFSHENNDDFTSFDIHRCIETSLNLARHELKDKVRIVRQYDESMPMLTGSEGQLSQVFVNLLVNAAQAMKGDGEIRITTRFADGQSHIEVSDNGPGIPVEKLQTIFEPFFTTKPVGQGTGLGLSISQDIIKRHNGKLDVSSTPGNGCTFTIDLPAARGQQDARHHAA